MWSDNETDKDLIGFRVHAELLRDVVKDDALLPVTIGVFGDWGSGKTSIMKMLQAELKQHEDIAVIYFDAWLFEGYDDAKSALLSSILAQLASNPRFPVALQKKLGNLVKRVNWMRVLRMGWDKVALPTILAYASGGATAVPGVLSSLKRFVLPESGKEQSEIESEELGKLLVESKESEITDVKEFRKQFKDLIEETKFKSVVVIIDDLDRCSPDRIVENLEAIKLFLNVERTAFVIGADPRIVRHGIAVRYRQALEAAKTSPNLGENALEAAEQLVRDYVEKLIQIPYHLPRLSPSEIETYLSLLFANRDLQREDFEKCLKDCEAFRKTNRFGPFGLSDITESLKGKIVPEKLKSSLTFTAGAAHLIADNLKGNPRQVKRFLNAFVLRQKLANVAKMDGLRDDVLLKLMLLEYSNEVRFRELARWHETQDKTPDEIIGMETNKKWPEEWSKPQLRRWIEMEPQLSAVELSDYFWLVRDRLASSQVGLSLTSPAVKVAYQALLSETGRKQSQTLLRDLREGEIESLIGLLAKNLQRDAANAEGYNAFLHLSAASASALSAFGKLLKDIPADSIPIWVVSKLQLLGREKPPVKAQTEEMINFLKTLGDSKVARAAAKKKE